jgi:hypothetical protein
LIDDPWWRVRIAKLDLSPFLAQVVHTSRRLIYRLLGWSPWSGVFFRLVDRLHG